MLCFHDDESHFYRERAMGRGVERLKARRLRVYAQASFRSKKVQADLNEHRLILELQESARRSQQIRERESDRVEAEGVHKESN